MAERRMISDSLTAMKNLKLHKVIGVLDELLDADRRNLSRSSLPIACYNSSIRKRRNEMVDALQSDVRLDKLIFIKSGLNDCVHLLEKMLRLVQPHSSNLILDVSKLLAREITKRVMRKIK